MLMYLKILSNVLTCFSEKKENSPSVSSAVSVFFSLHMQDYLLPSVFIIQVLFAGDFSPANVCGRITWGLHAWIILLQTCNSFLFVTYAYSGNQIYV